MVGGLPRAACPRRSSITKPLPRGWTLPGPGASSRSSLSLFGLGEGPSSKSFGVGCSAAPSALSLQWLTLVAACYGSLLSSGIAAAPLRTGGVAVLLVTGRELGSNRRGTWKSLLDGFGTEESGSYFVLFPRLQDLALAHRIGRRETSRSALIESKLFGIVRNCVRAKPFVPHQHIGPNPLQA